MLQFVNCKNKNIIILQNILITLSYNYYKSVNICLNNKDGYYKIETTIGTLKQGKNDATTELLIRLWVLTNYVLVFLEQV